MKPVTLTKNDRSIVDAVAGLILRATPEGGLAWALRADASGALTFHVGAYPGLSTIEACIKAAAMRGKFHAALERT